MSNIGWTYDLADQLLNNPEFGQFLVISQLQVPWELVKPSISMIIRMDCNAIGEIIGDESYPVQPQNTLRLKVSYKKLRLDIFPTESDVS